MDFAEYQEQINKLDHIRKAQTSLLGLVGEIGDLHSVLKKREIEGPYTGFTEELGEELGDTLWYLSSLASKYKLSLQSIADANLLKTNELFSDGKVNRFDADFPEDERFPRKFEVLFKEKELGKTLQVKIVIGEVFIGDALTDNSDGKDGYRYHDAFHLAYAAILGWSPVVRDLLKRKRKSNPAIDEVQDGARAKIVEEAISIFIFNHAKHRSFFENKNAIDIHLLKTVRKLCGELEVKSCTAQQWKEAIWQGYEMFRLLLQNKGGKLLLDLDNASIKFESSVK